MTTKDYLEDYAELWRFAITNPDSIGNDKRWERMQEIIKELEASIRKEVVEELLEELLTEARKTDYADRTEYDVAYDFIKRIPFVKGITLK